MKLKYTEGIEIDTDGPFRILNLRDGWYLAGEGLLIPLKNEQEGLDYLEQIAKVMGSLSNSEEG